jgi:hypothetical protein
MAFKIHFKRLFNLKIYNGFLLDKGETSFFSMTNAQRELLLQQRDYDVRRDFQIVPTAATNQFLRQQRLQMHTDASGFFVGIEVVNNVEPVTPLPESSRMAFALTVRNASLANATNIRLAALEIPFRYYFTNADTTGKTYPSVSKPVLSVADLKKMIGGVNNKMIEMGEYTKGTGNTVLQANKTTVGTVANEWDTVPYFNFAHTGDRRALPKRFVLGRLFKNAKAILKTADGTKILKTIEIKSDIESRIEFDFSLLEKETFVNSGKFIKVKTPDETYTLQITVTGDITIADQPVFLFDALEDPSVLGIVEIINQGTLPNNWRIQNPKPVNGTETLPAATPEFEIRLAARSTYWHYLEKNILIKQSQKAHPMAQWHYSIAPVNGNPDNNLKSPNHTRLTQDTSKLQWISEIQQ